MSKKWWASIDTGTVCINACAVIVDTGAIFTVKLTRLPGNATSPAESALLALCAKSGLDIKDLILIIHGTTLATKTILQGEAAKTAILVTRGFRDVLFMGRAQTAGTICRPAVPPLSRRRFVLEVSERVLPGGDVHTPLDEKEIRDMVPLLKEWGIESVAICFLHSFKNPVHEEKARDALADLIPEMPVTMSHEILPFAGEFERFTATAVNAAIRPVSENYFLPLHDRIKVLPGSVKGILVMQSDGSVATPGRSSARPAAALLSGLAGGVNACWNLSLKTGRPNLVTLDMGGTCTGMGIIHRNQPLYTDRGTAGGHLLGFPALDIRIIAAGGESTASPDAELLKTDPRTAVKSAGLLTCTGANMLLGRLDPSNFITGKSGPKSTAAAGSVKDCITDPSGPDVKASALAAVDAVTSKIAAAVKDMLFSRGFDPRDYTMVAYGGAGPLHAAAIARGAGIPNVLVPLHPGSYSALGMLSPIRKNYDISLCLITEEADPDYLYEILAGMEAKVLEDYADAGITADLVRTFRSVDMRYRGQLLEMNMQFPSGRLKKSDLTLLGRAFSASFNSAFGFTPGETGTEIVRLRLSAVCDAVKIQEDLAVQPTRPLSVQPIQACSKKVFFGQCPVETPVYRRNSLFPATYLQGPAVIEQEGATTLLWPGMSLAVDRHGNLIIDVGDEQN